MGYHRWDFRLESVDKANALPDSKVHGAYMGPIWGRQDPGGPHVGPMNFAICADCNKWLHGQVLRKVFKLIFIPHALEFWLRAYKDEQSIGYISKQIHLLVKSSCSPGLFSLLPVTNIKKTCNPEYPPVIYPRGQSNVTTNELLLISRNIQLLAFSNNHHVNMKIHKWHISCREGHRKDSFMTQSSIIQYSLKHSSIEGQM